MNPARKPTLAPTPHPAVYVNPNSELGRITALHLARFGTVPESWRLVTGSDEVPEAIRASARHIRLTESWPEFERSSHE